MGGGGGGGGGAGAGGVAGGGLGRVWCMVPRLQKILKTPSERTISRFCFQAVTFSEAWHSLTSSRGRHLLGLHLRTLTAWHKPIWVAPRLDTTSRPARWTRTPCFRHTDLSVCFRFGVGATNGCVAKKEDFPKTTCKKEHKPKSSKIHWLGGPPSIAIQTQIVNQV